MIINDLHIVRAVLDPNETNTPLLIDPDRMLPPPIAAKRFEPVTRNRRQIIQRRRRIEHVELSQRHSCDPLKSPGPSGLEQPLRFSTTEALDHSPSSIAYIYILFHI